MNIRERMTAIFTDPTTPATGKTSLPRYINEYEPVLQSGDLDRLAKIYVDHEFGCFPSGWTEVAARMVEHDIERYDLRNGTETERAFADALVRAVETQDFVEQFPAAAEPEFVEAIYPVATATR